MKPVVHSTILICIRCTSIFAYQRKYENCTIETLFAILSLLPAIKPSHSLYFPCMTSNKIKNKIIKYAKSSLWYMTLLLALLTPTGAAFNSMLVLRFFFVFDLLFVSFVNLFHLSKILGRYSPNEMLYLTQFLRISE